MVLQADLFRAARRPDQDDCRAAIRAAMEAGADVNARGYEGLTPLHWAVRENPNAAAVAAAVQALLASGADVRAKNEALYEQEPVHLAAYNESAEAASAAVQALMAAGADVRAKCD